MFAENVFIFNANDQIVDSILHVQKLRSRFFVKFHFQEILKFNSCLNKLKAVQKVIKRKSESVL